MWAHGVIRSMARRGIVLVVLGIYLAAMVLLTIPAVLLLTDRDVPFVIAVPLGIMLASAVIIILMIPVRVYIALRHRGR
jgi:hypothetical protein